MTENRFKWDLCEHDAMFYDNGEVIDYDDVVDILNEQHENLKGCNKTAYNAIDTIKALTKENEQLKKEIGNLEHTKDFCAECCERLEKENEQLQSEIRKVKRAYEQLWMHKYK